MRKKLLWISFIPLILSLLNVNTIRVSAGVYPAIYIDPATTVNPNLTPGENYTISIRTDYNGSDVWGWELTLTYNPLVLEGVEVVNGDLITEDVGTTMFIPAGFNNTAGKLSLTCSAFFVMPGEPMPVTSGPGTLANITFRVVGVGTSDITLGDETILIGYNATAGGGYNIIHAAMPNHIQHGLFNNSEAPVTHDIAVISVTPSSTSVEAGGLVDIAVIVENQGTVAETFDVTIEGSTDRFNWWPIETKTVPILEHGTNTSLTFAWNTTKKGTYTIRAVATIVSGEEDTEDNTLESDDTVTVTTPEAPPGLPLELIIAIVVVVVVIGAVSIYVVKRRKKPAPE